MPAALVPVALVPAAIVPAGIVPAGIMPTGLPVASKAAMDAKARVPLPNRIHHPKSVTDRKSPQS